MTTLLRDVIDIPERVGTGDFVFKLAESVNDRRQRSRATWSQSSWRWRSARR